MIRTLCVGFVAAGSLVATVQAGYRESRQPQA
jgi:hypothetical protein